MNTGWLGNGQSSVFNNAIVTDGTMPARQAFETAGALFEVEKRELVYNTVYSQYEPSGSYGLVRTDKQTLLGIVSKQYEIVQNESLLRMAEFIREEVDMDTVVVLNHGAKIAFTALIRGASQDVVPGDTVKRRIVGYLGHDGKTGCGAIFTSIRVVCSNTLVSAMNHGVKSSIIHKTGAAENFDALIQSIDIARETFLTEVEMMQQMAETSITPVDFRHYLEQVYAKQLGEEKELEDLRKYSALQDAYQTGIGGNYAPGTLWQALNAVTEVETSTKACTRAKQQSKFASANFGSGFNMSKLAMEMATDMLLEV